MSFTPIIPFSGYSGWSFLTRTMEKQKAAFTASAEIQSVEAYFREKIPGVKSAADLVSDRRLLSVALGAFGLEDDINNKFFIRKVLEEGSLDTDALANKLSDKRYLELTIAFGFGDYETPRTVMSDFADKMLERFESRQFEVAVGEVDSSLRLAMNLERELPALVQKDTSENTKWFSIIGSEPLNSVFRTAFGLPASVSALDIDQQLRIYQDKSEQLFGSADPAAYAEPENLEKLLKTFLLRSQISAVSATTSGSVALQLLTSTAGQSFSMRL